MKTFLLVAGASMFAIAGTAQAQSSEFTGPYVGAMLGYDSSRLELDDQGDSQGGLLYGVVAGYDANMGGAVVGVEAEFSDSTARLKQRDTLVDGDATRLSAGRDLYLGGRVGLPVTSGMMVYGKGGYTNARTSFRYDQGDGWSYRNSRTLDGYRLGAGLELDRNRTVYRLEYRYSDYGSYRVNDIDTDIDASRHQIAATVGMRF